MIRYDSRPYGLRNQSSNQFARSSAWLPATLLAAVLTLGSCAPNARTGPKDDPLIPFDVAEIFFEFNSTDEDLGIHALIGGDAWEKLEIKGPRGMILDIKIKGRLMKQGLSEIFFESAEPSFDELSSEVFFNRFPAGGYKIKGVTIEGHGLESVVEVTHLIPDPPLVEILGVPLVECGEPIEDLPSIVEDNTVTITWTAPDPSLVLPTFPGLTSLDFEVENFKVVIAIVGSPVEELVIFPTDEEGGSYTIPAEFLSELDLPHVVKVEVLVREASFNQTLVEGCFQVVQAP